MTTFNAAPTFFPLDGRDVQRRKLEKLGGLVDRIAEHVSAQVNGTATLDLGTGRGVYEASVTVPAVGITAAMTVTVALANTTDDDENTPEMLGLPVFQGIADTDQITINAFFSELHSGPIKLVWSAS